MASLGRLTIDMVANLGGFETDMARASRTTQREMRKVSRQLQSAQRDADAAAARIKQLGVQIGIVAGIGLGLVVREFRNLSQEADRIQKLAISTGLSAEAVQELGFAAEQSGSSLEVMVKGIQQMQRNIVQGSDELQTYLREFDRLGLSIEDLINLSPEEQFRRIAQAISELENPTHRTNVAMALLGRAGRELVPLLREGREGIDQFASQLQRTGSIMSQETVDATAKFNDALNVLKLNIQGVRNRFFADIIEPLANIVHHLATAKDGTETFKGILDSLKAVAIALSIVIAGRFALSLTLAIVQLVQAQRQVRRMTAEMAALGAGSAIAATRFAALGRAITLATGPIGIIITVLGTFALTSRNLFGDLQLAAQGIDDVNERAKAFIQTMERGREALGLSLLDDLADEMRSLRDEIDFLESATNEQLIEIFGGSLNQAIGRMLNRVAELREELTETEGNFDAIGRKILEQRKATEDAGEGYEDLTKEIKNANQITKEYESLLDGLVRGLRPIRAAQQQFAQGMQIAQRALLSGKISLQQFLEVFQLLNEELQQNISGQDVGTTFDEIKSALEAEVEALEGGAEAWEEYAKAQEVARRVAESNIPLTEQQVQEIRELVDRMFAASGVTKDTAEQFQRLGGEMVGALRDAQSLFAQGSKEAREFEVAIAAVNIVLGVMAILKQLSEGDFFSAIPRAIAVAAIVASLGVGVGGIGGGVSASQRRQETQGTGSVLGDTSAKTDSIVNATELTARTNAQLVGINRGMLQALVSLQSGIEGAVTLIAQGGMGEFQSVTGTIFGGLLSDSGILGDIQGIIRGITNIGFGDPLTDALIGLFSGKPKIKDQGIAILGGSIAELVDGVLFQAFQDVKVKSIFRTKNKELFADLDESVNNQFTLIFQGIVDAVTSAAEALGILPEEIQSRLDAFVVEAQKISLKDLSAEEQQAELLAVFGRIFDDLAAQVIPFIGQFQKIGEGMGETLVRVATSVQVFEEAVRRLGFSAERIDPEQFAQMSVGLIEAVGGIEEFISQMNSFVDNFASDSVKFQIAQDDLSRAFEMAGLVIPPTREAMFELMRSFDANTEAGREGIATLLRLADVADEYYSLLEDAIDTYAQTAAGLQESLALEPLSDFQREMVGIQRELLQTIKTLNDSGRAIVSQEQLEKDLAAAHERAAIRASQAIMRLEETGRSLVGQIFGTALDDVRRRIDELRDIESASQTAGSALQSFGQSLIDFADSLLIGSFSPLTSGNRLEEAMTQLLAASAAGDASAVQQLSQQVLQIGQSRFGSGQPFTDLFDDVQRIIRGTQVREEVQSVNVVSAPGISAAMRVLLEEQSRLEAEQAERERVLLTNELAQVIADFQKATGFAFADVAELFGTTLEDVAKILGLEDQELMDLLRSLQVDTDELAHFLEDLQDSIVDAITQGFEMGGDRRRPSEPPEYDPDPPADRRRTTEAVEDATSAVNNAADVIAGEIGAGNTTITALLQRIADTLESQPRNERARA